MLDMCDLMGDAANPCFTSNDVRRFLLEKHGLVVIHGSAYGKSGEGFLRISFAAGGTTLERGLALLRTGLCQFASGQWQRGPA
jgi:aspartate/methionine/tyrosine aminotransferase